MANLRNTNLNLFLVFSALMREQHLTRAGESIGLSQPGMSYSLKQLRVLFNDELFIKNKQSMLPTSKAIAIYPDIQSSLHLLSKTIDSQHRFDPSASSAHFHIGLNDYAAMVFLSSLYRTQFAKAPNLGFTVHAISNPEKSGAFERGDIDLAVGVFDTLPKKLAYHELYREKIVMLYDPKHVTVKKKFSIKQFLASPHVLLDFRESPPLMIKHQLQRQGLKRKVAFTLPQITMVGRVIKNTNLISAVPLRVAKQIAKQDDLALAELPIQLQPFHVCLVWHKRNTTSPDNRWLREIFMGINQAI